MLNEIRGRMIEEIVLLETKMVHSDKQVFKLQFANGEFDMAVVDPDSITTEIYEIRDSTEMVPEHYKDLVDEEKCRATGFRFGTITRRAVIYRGDDATDGDVWYLNVGNTCDRWDNDKQSAGCANSKNRYGSVETYTCLLLRIRRPIVYVRFRFDKGRVEANPCVCLTISHDAISDAVHVVDDAVVDVCLLLVSVGRFVCGYKDELTEILRREYL